MISSRAQILFISCALTCGYPSQTIVASQYQLQRYESPQGLPLPIKGSVGPVKVGHNDPYEVYGCPAFKNPCQVQCLNDDLEGLDDCDEDELDDKKGSIEQNVVSALLLKYNMVSSPTWPLYKQQIEAYLFDKLPVKGLPGVVLTYAEPAPLTMTFDAVSAVLAEKGVTMPLPPFIIKYSETLHRDELRRRRFALWQKIEQFKNYFVGPEQSIAARGNYLFESEKNYEKFVKKVLLDNQSLSVRCAYKPAIITSYRVHDLFNHPTITNFVEAHFNESLRAD